MERGRRSEVKDYLLSAHGVQSTVLTTLIGDLIHVSEERNYWH